MTGMRSHEGQTAIVTGAGRGLGREHALLLAEHGVSVVVNDLGTASDGSGRDVSVAQLVVDEITARGGKAVANTDSVTDWDGSRRLIDTAVETFGRLDILVNNAGSLRDRMLVNMEEADFDGLVEVHLKGHFCPLRHAAAYWRDQSKAGHAVKACVVNTTSASGLMGNVGQTNYGAAKAGIAAMTLVAAQELARYGVRVNAIAPVARTRLTTETPGLGDLMSTPEVGLDPWHPANVSPLVVALCSPESVITGQVFFVMAGVVRVMQGWSVHETLDQGSRWEPEKLAAALAALPMPPPPNGADLFPDGLIGT
jgi:NAD(P)-dependent dehydrogenase (short-subunit alcohol dehydrogenase family)